MDPLLLEEKDPAKIAAAVENSLRALLAKGPPKKPGEQVIKLLAIEGSGVPPPGSRRDESDSDSEADEPREEELPPGPIHPQRCAVSGPGFSGGAAGVPAKVVITAKDCSGKRIREGGAYMVVYVEPGPRAAHTERIEAQVSDHNDGTYTAVYTVPSKGDYKLCIEVNGQPLGDSPFPVFFSAAPAVAAVPVAPAPAPAPAPQPAPAPAANGDATGAAVAGAVGMPQLPPGAAAFPALAAAFPNLGGPALSMSLGQQAVQVGVKFPAEEDKLSRMLLVGGISPFATAEQLRSVFGFCGTILSIELTGPANSYAFVEYGSSGEATAALAMNGVQLLGQHMNVELASAAKAAADAAPPPAPVMDASGIPGLAMMGLGAANPFLSAQMQQLQQFQMLQQQQAALAEQVVTLRAMQRAGGAPAAAGALGSNDQQKSAAIAAAIALSKRLAVGKSGQGGEGEGERKRSRSRSRSKDRSKRRRSRSRSRSRERRERSRERARRERSRERREKERRERERRERSRERQRARSRERRSSRERRADRGMEKEWSRRDDKDRREERGRERGKEGSRREGSRERRRDRSKERGSRRDSKRDKRDRSREKDKGREKRSRRDRSRERGEGEKEGKDREERSPEQEEKSAQREDSQQGGQEAAAETSSQHKSAGDDLEDMLNELEG